MLFHQLITRFKDVHTKGIVHCDIKPANFLMGLGEHSNTVYIADFGISLRYINRNGQHIPLKTNCNLIGTVRYASLYAHKGMELSRRDDMLALGYFVYYVLNGNLPWQDDISPDSSRCRVAAKKKYRFCRSIQVKLGPPEFADYIQYCEELSFKAEPDYNALHRLIENVAARERINLFDNCFDWNLIKASKQLYTHKVKQKDSKNIFKSYYMPPEISNCDNMRRDARIVTLAKGMTF